MKPITIKNEYGETIEVKWDADGNIQIRHSDINKQHFGQLHEYVKRSRQPQVEKYLRKNGINANNPLAKEVLRKMGSYMVIEGESYFINETETAMILAAVKQHGGTVPNWTSHP